MGDRPDDEDVIFLRMPKGLDEVQAHRTEVLGMEPDPRLNYRDSRGREMYYRVLRPAVCRRGVLPLRQSLAHR